MYVSGNSQVFHGKSKKKKNCFLMHHPLFSSNSSNQLVFAWIQPELFYLAFSLFDVRNNQKISENFYCIPNYDIFSNQLKTTKSSSSKPGAKNRLLEANANGVNTLSKTVFSLDGQSVQNIQSIASGDGAPGLGNQLQSNHSIFFLDIRVRNWRKESFFWKYLFHNVSLIQRKLYQVNK